MNRIQEAALQLASLSIYRKIGEQEVPGAFYRLLRSANGMQAEEFVSAWGDFLSVLAKKNAVEGFATALTDAVLFDDNPFSAAAAAGENVASEGITRLVGRDLAILKQISEITPADVLDGCAWPEFASLHLPSWHSETPFLAGVQGPSEQIEWLRAHYQKNGYGPFARAHAFIWRDRQLFPVQQPDPIVLSDLKGYEVQRNMVLENTRAFVAGLPANNCLLYGDRGTGKSSTVKALLHEFPSLRLIEMPKEAIPQFPDLVAMLADLPMRFIVFIDDLSFSRQDDTYASLKAVLEGGLAVRPDNTLIYATSNRRHLLRETFSDREGDEIHRGDTIQESMSLADRFGLSVRFMLPDKAQYLEIIEKLAMQRGLTEHLSQLYLGAERWATERGGRSPRCARQYIRHAEAKIRQGKSLL